MPPIVRSGAAYSAQQITSFQIDAAELAKFRKKIERWDSLPLRQRMSKGTLAAAEYLRRPIAAAAPVERRAAFQRIRHNPGWLKRSVKARQGRKQVGFMGVATQDALVGPTAPHRHLVIRGTPPHSLETKRPGRSPFSVFGTDQVRPTRILRHPGSRPNPFVDEAAKAHRVQAYRVASEILFRG